MRILRVERGADGGGVLIERDDVAIEVADEASVGTPVEGLGVGVLGQVAGRGATWYFMSVEPGGSVGTHANPGEAVCFQTLGTITLELPDGTSTVIEPGDAVLFGDDAPHGWRNHGTAPSLTGIARLGLPVD